MDVYTKSALWSGYAFLMAYLFLNLIRLVLQRKKLKQQEIDKAQNQDQKKYYFVSFYQVQKNAKAFNNAQLECHGEFFKVTDIQNAILKSDPSVIGVTILFYKEISKEEYVYRQQEK